MKSQSSIPRIYMSNDIIKLESPNRPTYYVINCGRPSHNESTKYIFINETLYEGFPELIEEIEEKEKFNLIKTHYKSILNTDELTKEDIEYCESEYKRHKHQKIQDIIREYMFFATDIYPHDKHLIEDIVTYHCIQDCLNSRQPHYDFNITHLHIADEIYLELTLKYLSKKQIELETKDLKEALIPYESNQIQSHKPANKNPEPFSSYITNQFQVRPIIY